MFIITITLDSWSQMGHDPYSLEVKPKERPIQPPRPTPDSASLALYARGAPTAANRSIGPLTRLQYLPCWEQERAEFLPSYTCSLWCQVCCLPSVRVHVNAASLEIIFSRNMSMTALTSTAFTGSATSTTALADQGQSGATFPPATHITSISSAAHQKWTCAAYIPLRYYSTFSRELGLFPLMLTKTISPPPS